MVERVEGRQERGATSGGGVEPAPCHGHHAGIVAGADRLLEGPIGSCTELQLVGAPSVGRELADALLFTGQNVAPAALQHSGYVFRHSSLEAALRGILGK